jgi:outer membrane protein assembly factor BamB
MLAASGLFAQGRGGANWTTSGNDAQRTGWMRTDTRISPQTMAQPGFRLLWKLKPSGREAGVPLTEPLMIASIGYGFRGIKAMAFVGGSENVYGLDYELGRLEWTTHLNYSSIVPPAVKATLCPGSLTLTRPTPLAPVPAPVGAAPGGDGRAGGRASSGVGEPGRGAVTMGQGRGGPPAAPAGGRANAAPQEPGAVVGAAARGAAPVADPAGRGGGAGGGRGAGGGINNNSVIAIGADGFAHVFNVQNGADWMPPVEFLPPNSTAAGGAVLIGSMLYAAVSNDCGGVGSGVWAVDLASQDKKPINWPAPKGSIVGSAGPAFGSDGTVYVSTDGGLIVALDGKTLNVKTAFTSTAGAFRSAPIVFAYKGRDLVAAAGGDGRLYLLDSAAMGTPLAISDTYTQAAAASRALATWQDTDGTRWILAPAAKPGATKFALSNGIVANGTIAAFKVAEDGKVSLTPVWTSRDLLSPWPPIVVNGVVFALSAGDSRATAPTSAVLYALDGRTGKVLWTSAATITAPAGTGGLAASAGQVYVTTRDGVLWAFGMPVARE